MVKHFAEGVFHTEKYGEYLYGEGSYDVCAGILYLTKLHIAFYLFRHYQFKGVEYLFPDHTKINTIDLVIERVVTGADLA